MVQRPPPSRARSPRARRRALDGGRTSCWTAFDPVQDCPSETDTAEDNPFAVVKKNVWSSGGAADGDSEGTACTSGLSSPQSSPRNSPPRDTSPAPTHGNGKLDMAAESTGTAVIAGVGAAAAGKTPAGAASLGGAPQVDDRPFLEHVVQPHDTLAGICLRYKATARELAKLNNFSGEHFRVCAVLVVPHRSRRPPAAAAARSDGGPAVAALLSGDVLSRDDPRGWLALAKVRLFARETGVSEPRARHVLELCSWDYASARSEWEDCFGGCRTPSPSGFGGCGGGFGSCGGRSGGGVRNGGEYLPPPRQLRHARSWGGVGAEPPGARDRGWDGPRRRGSFAWEDGIELRDLDDSADSAEQQPLITIW